MSDKVRAVATLAAAVLAAFAQSAVCAEVFTYVDHWPSGTGDETATEVVVPSGATAPIATADDVARVTRLTAISLGSGAKVSYTASTALALDAAVSGEGAFIAENAGALTIGGDNAGLVAPGHFAFTNTPVTVGAGANIGSSASGTTEVYFGTRPCGLYFTANGAGVCTNDVPLVLQSFAGSTTKIIGTVPNTAKLVQKGNFTFNGGRDNPIYLDGSLEFLSCRVASGVSSKTYPAFAAASGASPHLWFTGNCTYYFSGYMYMSAIANVHFNGTSNFDSAPAYHRATCHIADAIKGAWCITPVNGSTLDLNGLDQTVKYFENTNNGGNPTESAGKARYTFTSPTAAMLILASNVSRTMPARFTGAAGLRHSNTGTGTFVYGVSDSTNVLDVAKGKVILKWGAGWGGDVNVASGAELECDSDHAVHGGGHRLVVASDGRLVVKSGALVYVASANIAGTELDAGKTYTVAALRDEMGLPVDGDDDAAITVKSTGWQGWPADGGDVTIEGGTTAYIADSDVEKVRTVSSILLMPGSSVVCTNYTQPLVLSAAVSGSGSVVAADSAGVVLAGDNSGLVSPGSFWFTNTPVVVSNRYGLGSVATARVTYNYGSLTGSLRFGGSGLVCDASVALYAAQNSQFVIGPDSPDETLIFSNSFAVAGYNRAINLKNKVRFSGGTIYVIHTVGSPLGMWRDKASSYAEVWFDSGVKPSIYQMFASDLTYHLGWREVSKAYCEPYVFYLYEGDNTRLVCETENLLANFRNGYGWRNWSEKQVLDLNGYDQKINHFDGTHALKSMIVTSAVPATVTLVNGLREKGANYATVSARFRGAAAFTYADSIGWTNTFTKYFSDTTGALTVEKGTLKLANGAGWGGSNVVVRAGATLVVESSAATNAFEAAGSRSSTALAVEPGGTLQLDSEARPVRVRSLTYGGELMPRGFYDRNSGVGIAGPGRLRALHGCDDGMVLLVR